MIISQILRSGFWKEVHQFFFKFFKGFHFGPLETVVCMEILEIFLHFKLKQRSKHIKKQQKAQKSQRIRTLDMQAKQTNTNTNTTEHELKYLKASWSSFLKLVFDKLKPIEAMQNNYNSNLFTTMVNLKEA